MAGQGHWCYSYIWCKFASLYCTIDITPLQLLYCQLCIIDTNASILYCQFCIIDTMPLYYIASYCIIAILRLYNIIHFSRAEILQILFQAIFSSSPAVTKGRPQYLTLAYMYTQSADCKRLLNISWRLKASLNEPHYSTFTGNLACWGQAVRDLSPANWKETPESLIWLVRSKTKPALSGKSYRGVEVVEKQPVRKKPVSVTVAEFEAGVRGFGPIQAW